MDISPFVTDRPLKGEHILTGRLHVKSDRTYRVGVSGSYGGLNMGDEAILESIITRLQDSLPVEITVLSRNPADTMNRYPGIHAVAAREMTRSEITPVIEGLDLFILGGGGIIYDADAKTYLREVNIAHDLGVPVMVYAISAGPLNVRAIQEIVRDALNRAAVITVRERGAKKILEDAGVECDIIITADPALLLEPKPLSKGTLMKEHMDVKRRLVGLSVREPGPAAPDIDTNFYHGLLADVADYIIDRYNANVVFIPMERSERDLQHAHAVISKMMKPQQCSVLAGEYTPGQILTLMERFDMAVGMRLHFLIFAALQGVPFIGLPYSTKVLYFLKELDMETPPLNLVNAGRLIAHLDHIWDTKDTIADRIAQSLSEMKRRALKNNQIAVSMLKGLHPKRKELL